jgi:aminopeptidase N
MRWSDYHYPGPAYGVASYPKPGSVLIALRGVLGEDVFNEAWKTFMKRWSYKHPTPFDLFNTFEDVSGQDLDWFWRSWYYETWTLDQAISSVEQTADRLVIEVEDLGLIPMPVDLTLTFEDGTRSDLRIPVEKWLEGRSTITHRMSIDQPVKKVEIDAAYNFPDRNRSNNIWQ